MSIALASETPEVQQKGARANFRWTLVEPWDERRLAAFLMTKHRRNDSDWSRRPSPFLASLGQKQIECSVPLGDPASLPDLERVLTAELKGILSGASKIHEKMAGAQDWRAVSPP
ncbi:MAG: hypothetical protein ACRD3M_07690 [Thermoanaerobaculia bacterium]